MTRNSAAWMIAWCLTCQLSVTFGLTGTLEAETLILSGAGSCAPGGPQIASHPGGGFVAMWADGSFVHLRRFDRYGAAVGSGRVFPGRLPPTPQDLLAVTLDGITAVAMWDGIWRIHVLDPDLRPVSLPVEVDAPSRTRGPLLAVDAGGDFVAAWEREGKLAILRLDRRGEPVGPPVETGPLNLVSFLTDLVVQPDGDLWLLAFPVGDFPSLVYTVQLFRVPVGASEVQTRKDRDVNLTATDLARGAGDAVVLALGTPEEITLLRLDDSLEPVAPPTLAAELTGDSAVEELELVSDEAGNLLVGWALVPATADGLQTVSLQTLTPEGRPAGPGVKLTTEPLRNLFIPDLSAAPLETGEVVVAWGSGPRSPEAECQENVGPFAVRMTLGGPRALLLGDGRFRVEVTWEDPFDGGEGVGHAIPDTDDSGGFWFFDPDNTELKIKVIDGRAVNGRFWFFYGALSNVEYRLTVTDQRTGLSKTYDNPPGVFGSFADTFAFPAP